MILELGIRYLWFYTVLLLSKANKNHFLSTISHMVFSPYNNAPHQEVASYISRLTAPPSTIFNLEEEPLVTQGENNPEMLQVHTCRQH